MSFQWIIDRAETIAMNRKKIVASTTARDGMTRTVSRGTPLWKITVKVPDGIPWTDLRQYITQAEYLDKTTTANIQISDVGQNWIVKYQGNSTLPSSYTASWTYGANIITVFGGGVTSSGYKFRAGDFIQLGTTGRVYTVAADVPYNSSSVTLHRPVLESNGTGTVLVGENCIWKVKCIDFPDWTLMAYNQVSWSGAFVFVEAE